MQSEGTCLSKKKTHELWRSDSVGTEATLAATTHGFSRACASVPTVSSEGHMIYMLSDHSESGHQHNQMYSLVKTILNHNSSLVLQLGEGAAGRIDSLEESRVEDWDRDGYTIPSYTANVPPTYKKTYEKTGAVPPSKTWYKFQTLLEQGDPILDPQGKKATYWELYNLMMHGAYQHIKRLKPCEFPEGCVDFGWLDRLIYRGSTAVLQYRTLKMHPDYGVGDHSPLFMLLQAQESNETEVEDHHDGLPGWAGGLGF